MKTLLLAAVMFGGAGATQEWIGPDPIVQNEGLNLPICVEGNHLNYDATNNIYACGLNK